MRIVCPLCRRVLPDVPEDFGPRPFCSAQCKLADLHNWLNETYRISTATEASDMDAQDGPEEGSDTLH